MKNFELEKLKFEREQLKLALDKAVDELSLNEVKVLVKKLAMDPLELRDLQAKTSQLPNLHRKEADKYKKAKILADYINQQVSETRHDKSQEQQDFLSTDLLHHGPSKNLNSETDDAR